jgi:hypothetical protein
VGLCKKVFLGASRQIKFGWRDLFPDFASQNQEKDLSIQRIFRRHRRRKPFYTTPALRAKLCFERHVIFTISLREIVKMTCLSEEYSAAEGGKNLFTQPHYSTTRLIPEIFKNLALPCPTR